MKPILTHEASAAIAEEFNCYPNFRTEPDDLIVIENCNFDPVFAVPKNIEPDDLKSRLEQFDIDLKGVEVDEKYTMYLFKIFHEI